MVPGVYFYGIVENNMNILCTCILATIQMVFTVGAAAEAAVASVFIAIACNPIAFARLHPLLIKNIWSDTKVPEGLDLLTRVHSIVSRYHSTIQYYANIPSLPCRAIACAQIQ